MNFLRRWFLHPLQGGIANSLYFLMGLIPFELASHLGGAVARTIGPHLSVSQVARQNLKEAFGEKSEAEIEEIVRAMWDNLGRVAFEFPHIARLNVYEDPDRFEIVGRDHIRFMADQDRGIFYSGHLANWEFSALALAHHDPAVPVHLIYREPNNPWMRTIFARRKPTPDCGLIPKGVKGARQAMGVLKSGGYLAMLVDQKMNDGIAVPFFGRAAMTAPAMAQFALRYDCPIVPVCIERIEKVRFRITFFEPIFLEKSDDKTRDIEEAMTQVNQNLESWIRQRPEQWLWVHRRWPKKETS